MKRDSKLFFVKGLPIKGHLKVKIVSILLFLLFLNTLLPRLFENIAYSQSYIVTIVLVGLILLFSFGSIYAETIVVGVLVLLIISNWWDLGLVNDFSSLRVKLMKWTFLALTIELIFGRISFINLIDIIRRTLGGGHK